VVITSDRGLVLVDPGGSPVVARLLRQAISRELGRSRIAYVIDHHHHWGHTLGNVAFPESVIIGHEAVVPLMTRQAAFLDNFKDRFRVQLEDATTRLAGVEEGSAEAVAAREMRDQAQWMLDGLSETGFTIRPPDLTFSERLMLDLGNLRLEFHTIGPGHSATDTVVFIPEERVLLMGCFFFMNDGLPIFGAHPEPDVDRWFTVLDRVLDGDRPVEHVVLGQHALWSGEELRGWRDYLAGLWRDVQRLESEGVTLAVAQERLPMPPELSGLVHDAVDPERLAAYQHDNVERLWRTLKEGAANLVGRALDEGGIDAALALYRELSRRPEGDVIFSEVEFNQLGYRLLGEDRLDEAIAIFEINVDRYPESWNVYDSLGEAHMLRGDRERAISLYRRSLELNPDNRNGVTMLQRLGVEP
jgi:glyoxylase-like metal-dependent hydrolase (beta-lactamase superfamily II)